MAFVPVDQTVEVRLEFLLGVAEVGINVLHFLNPDEVTITGAVADDFADAIEAAWTDNLQGHTGDGNSLNAVTVKDISAADMPVWRRSIGVAGTNVNNELPYQLAVCATLRTLVGSRSGRGRVFLCGFTEQGNGDGGLIDAGLASDVKAFLTAIQSIASTGADPDTSFILGVTSREAHVGGDPLGVPIAPITRGVDDIDVNRRWDTQRRRANKIRI